jgi:hypothetical protein
MPSVKIPTIELLVGGELTPVPPKLRTKLEEVANEFYSESAMQPPARLDLPFFAYGLFKPGQLGFDSIREFVREVIPKTKMAGVLYERDGVPLFVDVSGMESGDVAGALLTFDSQNAETAYRRIAAIEPEQQYQWGARRTEGGVEANVLISRSSNGAHRIDDSDWDGHKDPHFGPALRMVENSLAESMYADGSVERLMELQMAYMLLWTAIERYTSLRYHLRKRTMMKIMQMAKEPAFGEALKKHVHRAHEVYSTDATDPARLLVDNPKRSLEYYYQVRSNVTHRGKALMVDAELLRHCITELLAVFQETIHHAFCECQSDPTPAIAIFSR